MKSIDIDRARQLIDAGATVLDVLPEPTYRRVHIPGAINRPLSSMTRDAVDDLDPSNPVVVYCFDQRCDLSARAAARLDHFGFTDVNDLAGGRAAWTVLGLPTEGTEGDRRRVAEFLVDVPAVGIDASIADVPTIAQDLPIAVVDACGVLLGSLDPVATGLAGTTPVEAAMVPAPGTIRPDVTIDEALEQLHRDHLPYSFVTTARGELLGVVRADAHV